MQLRSRRPFPGAISYSTTGLFSIGSMLAALAIGFSTVSAAEGNNANPKQGTPATRKSVKEMQEEFLKLKFGMFIHYNMATYTGEQWVTGYPDPSTFNPGGKVDTDAWADAAKSAGMKYAILTVKACCRLLPVGQPVHDLLRPEPRLPLQAGSRRSVHQVVQEPWAEGWALLPLAAPGLRRSEQAQGAAAGMRPGNPQP